MRALKLLMAAMLAIATMAAAPGSASEPGASVNPRQVLQQLLDGNQRFVAGALEHPNQSPARRAETASGQHPVAAILACSDSRSGPEILFDRGLGDLFVVRLAGNVATQVAIESIDYAVTHLGVRLVLVLGHQRCGAVIAAVEGNEEPGDVGPMLRELRPAVERTRGKPGDPVANAVSENVTLVVQKLVTSKELASIIQRGDLKVVGAIYDLSSGKIEVLKD